MKNLSNQTLPHVGGGSSGSSPDERLGVEGVGIQRPTSLRTQSRSPTRRTPLGDSMPGGGGGGGGGGGRHQPPMATNPLTSVVNSASRMGAKTLKSLGKVSTAA